jgi:hypothetical protein
LNSLICQRDAATKKNTRNVKGFRCIPSESCDWQGRAPDWTTIRAAIPKFVRIGGNF